MDTLYIRIPLPLKRRILLAAASQNLRVSVYVRRQVEGWLRREASDLPKVEYERLRGEPYRLPLPGHARQRIRNKAFTLEIPINTLVIRVLDATVPHPTELLLEAATGGPHV